MATRARAIPLPDEHAGPSPSVQSSARTGETADDDVRRIGPVYLSLLALSVGIVTGFGALACRELIGLIHNA